LVRVVLATLIVASVASVADVADAKPTKAALRKAARHFKQGDRAYRLGNYGEAIKGFEAAYALSEDPLVLLNIAQALRKQFEIENDTGKLTRARDLYKSFLREAPQSPERANVENVLKGVEEKIAEREVAGGRDDAVAAAKLLAEQQQYDKALAELDKAEQRPNNSTADLIDIHKFRGILLATSGREADAQVAFSRLLALDPGHQLPVNVERPVMRAFASARSWWTGKQPPRLAVDLPKKADEAKPLVVQAKVPSDPLKMVARVDILVRVEGRKEFVRYQGTLVPGQLVASPGVEIVVLGVDSYGGTVCTEGTLENPLRVRVGDDVPVPASTAAGAESDPGISISTEPEEPATPWYKKPLVWGAVGAAVAGGVVAAILIARDEGGSDGCTGDCQVGAPFPNP
jgi:hypothetical protein